MKIFVSQPMSGREEEEVLEEKNKYADAFVETHKDIAKLGWFVIDNYHKPNAPKDAPRLWYLADSLRQMSEADIVLFVPGWKKAKGCRVEMMCCKLYGVPFIKMKKI